MDLLRHPPTEREPLTPVDTAWLRMGQETNAMVITSVIVLDGGVRPGEIESLLGEKLLRHRRFSQRIVDPHVAARLPHWERDPHFDLRNHVHRLALPAPRSQAALEELVSDLMSQPLDRARPLWQVAVVEGLLLENGREGTALVVRMHHCLGDGVALVGLLLSMTDEGRALEPRPPGHARHAEGALQLAREAADRAVTLGRILLLSFDAETPYKGSLGVVKRCAWSRPIPIAPLRRVAESVAGKINDVLLAACAGAMRADLLERGWNEESDVRALVPVHILGGRAEDGLGNHFGLVFVDLPITIADRLGRLREAKTRMDRVKGDPDAAVALSVVAAMGVASREVEHLGVALFTSKATAVVTNVAGPLDAVHLGGRKIDSVMVWAPVSGSIGLGFSLLSYAGAIRLGLATDAQRVSDPARIVRAFEQEIDALIHLA